MQKDGILLINKQINMTSHDVIDEIKKKFKINKIGHCGTLDPFASGLLIVLINNATKLQQLFLKEDKKYEGTFIFGKRFDTLDITGELIEEKDFNLKLEDLVSKANEFPNKYMQTPPIYSAVKVGGRRGYELARQKKEVKFDPREVEINNFKILNQINNNEFRFEVEVSSGTYIRQLAEDFAKTLNNIASLKTLIRTKSGNFNLKDSFKLDELTENNIISTYDFFANYPKVVVSDYIKHLVINGIFLDERQTTLETDFIAVSNEGEFLAYYQKQEGFNYKPIYFFKTREQHLKEKENNE